MVETYALRLVPYGSISHKEASKFSTKEVRRTDKAKTPADSRMAIKKLKNTAIQTPGLFKISRKNGNFIFRTRDLILI